MADQGAFTGDLLGLTEVLLGVGMIAFLFIAASYYHKHDNTRSETKGFK